MTSKLIDPAKQGFVWTWLPGATSPVVAGRIDLVDGHYQFAYSQSYLERGEPCVRRLLRRKVIVRDAMR